MNPYRDLPDEAFWRSAVALRSPFDIGCNGQVISDSLIGFFDVDSRLRALGDKLPSFECIHVVDHRPWSLDESGTFKVEFASANDEVHGNFRFGTRLLQENLEIMQAANSASERLAAPLLFLPDQ